MSEAFFIQFSVPGKPEGKGRPRFDFRTGHAYTPAETRQYEANVRACALEALLKWEEQHGASWPKHLNIELDLVAWIKVPASWPKWKRDLVLSGEDLEPAPVKPDLDNIEKAVMDGLQGVLFDDDKRVCEKDGHKWYGDEPSVQVTVIARRSRLHE